MLKVVMIWDIKPLIAQQLRDKSLIAVETAASLPEVLHIIRLMIKKDEWQSSHLGDTA